MVKLAALFTLSLSLILFAQVDGGFGEDFEKPERGGRPGKPPMDGPKMPPFDISDSTMARERKTFDSAFVSSDIVNKNAEAFIRDISPAASLPALSLKWTEISDSVKKRETQGEKNQALKLHRKYLSDWDTFFVALDSALAKEGVKEEIGFYLDSIKDTFVLIKDSMSLAIEMNKKSLTEMEKRLKETKGMLAQLNSNSGQMEQSSTNKTMLFILKVDIINMENDIEILNRERRLGEEILEKLDEFD